MKPRTSISSLLAYAAFRLVAVLAACVWSVALADELAAGAGHGNIFSQDSRALFLFYQNDAPKLFNRKSHYELVFAYWSGANRNSALTFGRALHWKISRNNYFTGALGVGLVNRTTDHLGTTGEFVTRIALGHKFGKYELSIGEIHYSNGKTSLGLNWDGPNTGENFFTVMLARKL